jgi:hypothetical protein
MAAGTGTLTLTGQSAALRYGRRLVAGTGTLTLAGQPVSLTRNRSMPAGTGTLTLAGQPVTLARTRQLAAGTGSLELYGTRTNLLIGQAPPRPRPFGRTASRHDYGWYADFPPLRDPTRPSPP